MRLGLLAACILAILHTPALFFSLFHSSETFTTPAVQILANPRDWYEDRFWNSPYQQQTLTHTGNIKLEKISWKNCGNSVTAGCQKRHLLLSSRQTLPGKWEDVDWVATDCTDQLEACVDNVYPVHFLGSSGPTYWLLRTQPAERASDWMSGPKLPLHYPTSSFLRLQTDGRLQTEPVPIFRIALSTLLSTCLAWFLCKRRSNKQRTALFSVLSLLSWWGIWGFWFAPWFLTLD